MEPIAIKPIGVVRSPIKEAMLHGWESVESEILLEEEWEEALEGLEGFSHIIVFFWMHKVASADRVMKKVRPGGIAEMPLVGVLATRSQNRPNPIGVAVVPLLKRRKNALMVRGLDSLDGSPVLDIKPYLPPYDALPQAKMPAWVWGPAS